MMTEREENLIYLLTSDLSQTTKDFIIKNLNESENFGFILDLIVSSSINHMYSFMRYLSKASEDHRAIETTEKVIKEIEMVFNELNFKDDMNVGNDIIN